MAFKGTPKSPTSGRKKGTPNKLSVKIEEQLAALDFNPIEKMVYLYRMNEDEDPAVAAKMLTELAGYIYPKRKAIEHSGEITNPFMNKSMTELEGLVRKAIEKK